jgi:DeoR family fructose operon transcriptional repressor
MKRCREAYVLADSSKFGHVSSVTFARFEDAQIITDHISDPVFQTCSNIEEAES